MSFRATLRCSQHAPSRLRFAAARREREQRFDDACRRFDGESLELRHSASRRLTPAIAEALHDFSAYARIWYAACVSLLSVSSPP